MSPSLKTALGTFGALIWLGAGPALGHARLENPQPRDQQDGYKDPPRAPPGTGAPCGIGRSVPAQPQTTFSAGQPLHVQWQETISHPGCFVIDFASANDAGFQVLGVKSHSSATGAAPREWSLDVVLPSAPCPACTLRLRQLMLPADLPDAQCPPATIPPGSTYYSCSNVTLSGADGGTSDARQPDAGRAATGGRAGTGGSTGVSTGTAGSAASSGGAVGSTGSGGAGVTGSGGQSPSGTGGATAASSGGNTASAPGSGGSAGKPADSSNSGGGGCTIAADLPSRSVVSIVSILCVAALGARRRRTSNPKKKEEVQ